MQDEAASLYARKLVEELDTLGAWDLVGKVIDGRLVTREGLLAVAWRWGASGATKELRAADRVGGVLRTETGARLENFRGTSPPHFGVADGINPSATLPPAVGPHPGEPSPEARSRSRVTYHASGARAYEFEATRSSEDGQVREGDLVSITYDAEGREIRRWVVHTDGTMEEFKYSEDRRHLTYTKWDRRREIDTQLTTLQPEDGPARVVGDFMLNGRAFREDGTAVPDPEAPEMPPVDPAAIELPEHTAIPRFELESEVDGRFGDSPLGIGETPAAVLEQLQLDLVPSGPVVDITETLRGHGFTVLADAEGVVAWRGDEYISVSDGVVEISAPGRHVRMQVVDEAVVIEDTSQEPALRYVLGGADRSLLVRGSVALPLVDDTAVDLATFRPESLWLHDRPLLSESELGLEPGSYATFGLTFEELSDGALSESMTLLLDGLDPAAALENGWSMPAVMDTDSWVVPEGFARVVDAPTGIKFVTHYDSDRRPYLLEEIESGNDHEQTITRYQLHANGTRTKVSEVLLTYGSDGSYVGFETDLTDRAVYRVSRAPDGVEERVRVAVLEPETDGEVSTVFSDLNGLIGALKSGAPIPVLASGLRLLNTVTTAAGQPLPGLGVASTVAAGVLSFYNLYNALQHGDAFSKLNATLTAVNFANAALIRIGAGSAELARFLNGPAGGLAEGAVGVLPLLGLVNSIRNDDAVGTAMSLGALFEGSKFFTHNPVGWALMGVSLLKAILGEDPPEAWGIAKVRYGEGFTNVGPVVHAQGEAFGPDRARAQLQNVVDSLAQMAAAHNALTADSQLHVGIIPQRMPSLTYRAAEFEQQGYSVLDIDALTGHQRAPFLRFDDTGAPIGSTALGLTPAERAMLSLPGQGSVPPLMAYMVSSALQRGAIAPLWEVRTAKLQEMAGDPDAGITEEERAAKAGLAAPLDTAYAASHPHDPAAARRRVGHFMVVGMDLSGNGRLEARSIADNAALGHGIAFDWDGQGFLKKTGWIGPGDGFLVLDHDFNRSVGSAKELFSNPLVADAAKGLRLLRAYDANADGRIDAADPVYYELKVWQDLNQDGDNTKTLTVGSFSTAVQDETGGVLELRSLQDHGIAALDYANGRYVLADGTYRLLATQQLEGEDEGVRYSPVGAGIQVELTNGAPQVILTQVVSEEAVYDSLQIGVAGETIGTPAAPLYEDGVPQPFNPLTQGGPRELVVPAVQLLQNDTWAGADGLAAGLRIVGVRAGEHLQARLRPDGNISLTLEPNYSGTAEFFYTVALPGHEAAVTPKEARVVLNITPVNDAPSVSATHAPARAIYGYHAAPYQYSYWTGVGENAQLHDVSGTARGRPRYEPYVEHIPAQPIYGWQVTGEGENTTSRWVLLGHTPEQNIPHHVPIAWDHPNHGRVLANDPDGGQFAFEIIRPPLFGSASVDAQGHWSYVGRRPNGIAIPDVDLDGRTDWAGFDENTPANLQAQRNIYSNWYGPDEPAPFLDYFTVRVYDTSDPARQTFHDVEIAATHYGPPPVPEVSDSGGGKKPIAIDLDGDGFHFTDVDDSDVFFEVNQDGWRRRIAWPERGDGLLAVDLDGNGKIERADEISFVPHAPHASTDLAALRAAFDSNGDGVFDARDAEWHRFGIWQDGNTNGVTDPGEFRSLDEMGIVSINLQGDSQFRVVDGQTIHGVGQATTANGQSLALADVTLRFRNETRLRTGTSQGGAEEIEVPMPQQVQGQALVGTAEPELVLGTAGSDKFDLRAGGDWVLDSEGDDVVDAGDGDDHVYTGVGNDVVFAGSGADSVYTGAGNDLVFGDSEDTAGDDVIFLDGGNDVAFGAAGNDFIAGGAGNDVISGNLGDDVLFGESGWDVLFGQEGRDELYGLDGDDMLQGGAGDDLLDGGEGADSIEGGVGDDTYVVDSSLDTIVERSGEGADKVRSSISYVLGEHLESLVLEGSAALQGTGNALDNLLVGNDGANTLEGGAGNDVLDGGRGADRLQGGIGNDTYHVDTARDVVIEAAGAGVDTVISRATYALAPHVENLILVGSGDLHGTGNELANRMVGNGGSNRLDAGAGGDVMVGGAGDDQYVVDDASDVVVEVEGEGADSVTSWIDYHLADHVEQLQLAGAARQGVGNVLDNDLYGNGLDNLLDGGSGADRLHGGAGDDIYVVDDLSDEVIENLDAGVDTVRASVDWQLGAHVENLELTGSARRGTGNELANQLVGTAGDDVLDGGAAGDRLVGGAGDDTYVVDETEDEVVEGEGEGVDTVLSAASYSLPQGVERLVLTGAAGNSAYGNGQDNELIGNAGDNLLDGRAGADHMAGAEGNDSYVVDHVGDVVTERPGEGVDLVRSSVDFVLPQHVENLCLLEGAVRGTGNAAGNSIEGNASDNVLDGAEGADRLAGGTGDDTYIVDDAGDQVVELPGSGFDTVIASVNYVLPVHVERLVLTGGAHVGGGNGLSNELIGNDFGNVLDGAQGADRMAGGAGDDVYRVDDTGDQIAEQQDAGTDAVEASVDWQLGANLETLVLVGSAVRATGNGLANLLVGNAQANVLDGQSGADRMSGGEGDDTYVVDDAGDRVEEAADGGCDTVFSGVSFVLPAHVENLALTGAESISGIGNDRNNTLVGNAGSNFLAGGAGNDTYFWSPGDGLDRIEDAAGIDTVRLSGGLTTQQVALRIVSIGSHRMAQLRLLASDGAEIPSQGFDLAVQLDATGRITFPIERFVFDDGTVCDWTDLLVATAAPVGTPGPDLLLGGRDGDALSALPGPDVVYGGAGADRLDGGDGDDIVIAGSGDDQVLGGSGADELEGGFGADTLLGGNGADYLMDLEGNNRLEGGNDTDVLLAGTGSDTLDGGHGADLLIAGAGGDRLSGGAGEDWLAGGAGADLVEGGSGRDVLAFNRGDGRDTFLGGSKDVLSLGGGIRTADIVLRKDQDDLVLDLGQQDSITFKGWYGSAVPAVDRLQVIESSDTATGTSRQVHVYDFAKLVQRFDSLRAHSSATDGWSVMNARLDAHLHSTDRLAFGGDLSMQYAWGGSVSGMGLSAVQAALGAGVATLQPLGLPADAGSQASRLA